MFSSDIFFLVQVRLLQQAKEAFAGEIPEMEDRSEDIAALKNRWHQCRMWCIKSFGFGFGTRTLHLCWTKENTEFPGMKGSSRTGRISTLLPWESLPRLRRELNFLGDFFLLVWTFLLFWTWQSFLTLYSCSNQNFELGDRLNEKEYRLKVKHPTQPRFGFMFFSGAGFFFKIWILNFCLF